MGADGAFVEEAAAMNQDVFFKVIAFLIGVTETAIIIISTVLTAGNFLSVLIHLKYKNGTPLFNTLIIKLQCDRCGIYSLKRKRGRDETTKLCDHLIQMLPSHKDAESDEMIRIMMSAVGREGDYDRESRAIITDGKNVVFDEERLSKLRIQKPIISTDRPKYLFVTCDPNGGGEGSETSLVAAYFKDGHMYICGMDTYPTAPNQRTQFIIDHIRALRAIPRFSKSVIVFVPESNLSDAVDKMLAPLYETPDIQPVYIPLDNKNMPGFRTGTGSKSTYTNNTMAFLDNDLIHFTADFASGNNFVVHSERRQATLKEFFSQLPLWRRIKRTGKDGQTYITYSGKFNELGELVKNQKDDLVIAFVLMAQVYFWIMGEMKITLPDPSTFM